MSAPHSFLLPVVHNCPSVHRSDVTRVPLLRTMAWLEAAAATQILHPDTITKLSFNVGVVNQFNGGIYVLLSFQPGVNYQTGGLPKLATAK